MHLSSVPSLLTAKEFGMRSFQKIDKLGSGGHMSTCHPVPTTCFMLSPSSVAIPNPMNARIMEAVMVKNI
jgi:hypothetical protein